MWATLPKSRTVRGMGMSRVMAVEHDPTITLGPYTTTEIPVHSGRPVPTGTECTRRHSPSIDLEVLVLVRDRSG